MVSSEDITRHVYNTEEKGYHRWSLLRKKNEEESDLNLT